MHPSPLLERADAVAGAPQDVDATVPAHYGSPLPEQAALVRVSDLAVLTDYLDAAYALIRDYLTDLDPASLDEVIDRSWQPPVTRASRLASIIDDAAQHSGQAVYSRRLLGLEG